MATTTMRVHNGTDAIRHARDALLATGCEPIIEDAPHRTRSTWIVDASCACCPGRPARVHVDPHSGVTRVTRP